METRPISIIPESNVAQEIKKTENSEVSETAQVTAAEKSNLQVVQPTMTLHETGEQVTDKNLTDRQSAVVAVTDEKSTKTDEAVTAKGASEPETVIVEKKSETSKSTESKEAVVSEETPESKETVASEKTSELKEATQLPSENEEIEAQKDQQKKNGQLKHIHPIDRLRELIKMRQEAARKLSFALNAPKEEDQKTIKTETPVLKLENTKLETQKVNSASTGLTLDTLMAKGKRTLQGASGADNACGVFSTEKSTKEVYGWSFDEINNFFERKPGDPIDVGVHPERFVNKTNIPFGVVSLKNGGPTVGCVHIVLPTKHMGISHGITVTINDSIYNLPAHTALKKQTAHLNFCQMQKRQSIISLNVQITMPLVIIAKCRNFWNKFYKTLMFPLLSIEDFTMKLLFL